MTLFSLLKKSPLKAGFFIILFFFFLQSWNQGNCSSISFWIAFISSGK